MKPVSVHAYNNIIHNYGLTEILVIVLYECLSWKFFLKNTHGEIFSNCISKPLTPTGSNSTIFDYIYVRY